MKVIRKTRIMVPNSFRMFLRVFSSVTDPVR